MAQNRTTTRRTGSASYRVNGSAAYDIHRVQYGGYEGNAVRKPQAPKPHRHAKPKPKAKLAVAPLSVVGLLAAACMLIFVLCGYVQLFEESAAVSSLKRQLSNAQEYNERLQATYDSKIDLDVIREKATALGMTLPNSKQTVYLSLEGVDRAVISGDSSETVFATAWTAVVRNARALVEYFGRKRI